MPGDNRQPEKPVTVHRFLGNGPNQTGCDSTCDRGLTRAAGPLCLQLMEQLLPLYLSLFEICDISKINRDALVESIFSAGSGGFCDLRFRGLRFLGS